MAIYHRATFSFMAYASGFYLRNLRALQAETRHQPLLAEDERIDVALGCRGRERLGQAGVHNHDARTDTHLEPLAFPEIFQRGVGHEEHDIREGLCPGLQAV